MLIFTLAFAMMLAMLIATFVGLHSEAKSIRIREQMHRRNQPFF